jgi:DNA-binding CsgD family transcriptional regulator
LYRRAVRNAPAELPGPARGRLLAALGDEAAAADDSAAAAQAYRRAHELAAESGDVRAAAALVPRMVAVGHLLGDDLATRIDLLQAALDSLAGLPGTDIERARLRAGMAAAYMLDRRLDEAIEHGRGLVLLSRGEVSAAYQTLESARAAWVARRRFWEGTWALLDLAAAAAGMRRHGAATHLADQARAVAAAAGASVIADAAGQFLSSLHPKSKASPWSPLSDREFEVSRLIASGLTNKQIAEQLVLAPKTVSAHVAHILAKLGATRRAEIAPWCATVQAQTRHPPEGRLR